MMQVSTVMNNAPPRPQIKRMSQKELHERRLSNKFNSSSMESSNKWADRRSSQVVLNGREYMRPMDDVPRSLDNHPKSGKEFLLCRGWFWLFGFVFCFILIIAIVAIVLGIVLRV